MVYELQVAAILLTAFYSQRCMAEYSIHCLISCTELFAHLISLLHKALMPGKAGNYTATISHSWEAKRVLTYLIVYSQQSFNRLVPADSATSNLFPLQTALLCSYPVTQSSFQRVSLSHSQFII